MPRLVGSDVAAAIQTHTATKNIFKKKKRKKRINVSHKPIILIIVFHGLEEISDLSC